MQTSKNTAFISNLCDSHPRGSVLTVSRPGAQFPQPKLNNWIYATPRDPNCKDLSQSRSKMPLEYAQIVLFIRCVVENKLRKKFAYLNLSMPEVVNSHNTCVSTMERSEPQGHRKK